jgi:hypothetical protein
MSGYVRRAAGRMLAAAMLVLAASTAGAETRRPSAAVLVAAAKSAALAQFEVLDELRGLTVEAWMRKLFGATPIAWRATSCRSTAATGAKLDSPICVEAVVRLQAGVTFTLGVGFDEEAPRPERKPNSIWGFVATGGKECEFYGHPDQVQRARPKIDAIVKAGGRCK